MQVKLKLKSGDRLVVANLTDIKFNYQGKPTSISPKEFLCHKTPYLFIGDTQLAVDGSDIEYVVFEE